MKKSNNDDNKNNSDNNNTRSDSSIFYIMDGIIDQLNKTKKLFIIMLLTIMIIPPIAFMLSFSILGSPFPFDNRNETSDEKSWDIKPSPSFRFLPLVPIIIVLVWLGIGIRQWFVLSKWDKKYKKYKELQKQIDEKLDDENKENR
jgi:NADH:ubiquinone oxidoreductase subunit 5 (subunit L)/multisubunit Na+/H+ antiporter MnhA subunit